MAWGYCSDLVSQLCDSLLVSAFVFIGICWMSHPVNYVIFTLYTVCHTAQKNSCKWRDDFA
jgi:hypothetical protein